MKDGNICSYIMPHKFLNADGAECFRNWLKQGTIVKRMTHFGANQIFKGATTYTCITEFSKSATDCIMLYKAPYKGNFVNEMLEPVNYNKIAYATIENAANLYGKNQWIMFGNETEFNLFEHIYETTRKIENVFNVFVGLQTSDDKLYILDRNEDGSFTVPKTGATYNLENEFFKPLLKGEDVHRYGKLTTNRYVFFPYKKPGYEPVGLDELERDYPLIDSDIRLAMTGNIRKYFDEHPDHFDPRQYLKPARQAVKDMVAHKIKYVLGSDGKA